MNAWLAVIAAADLGGKHFLLVLTAMAVWCARLGLAPVGEGAVRVIVEAFSGVMPAADAGFGHLQLARNIGAHGWVPSSTS